MASANLTEAPQHSVATHDLVAVLIRHFGIHEGKFSLAIKLRMGIGAVPGSGAAPPVPGAMMGIEELGIQPAPKDAHGAGIVDAALVNPRTAVAAKPKRSPVKKKLIAK